MNLLTSNIPLSMLALPTRLGIHQFGISGQLVQRPATHRITTRRAVSPYSTAAASYSNNEQRLRLPNSLRRSVRTRPPAQKRWQSNKVESTQQPYLSGLWKPTHLQRLYYGPESVKKHLTECLPTESSKAFVVTGTSLANKTGLIKQVEELLGKNHVATYSKIGQHAPIKQLDEATEQVLKDESIDTIISVGGGSPIDSAKAISYRCNERQPGKFLYHITIPTTLSAAECTMGAGYTNEDGVKTGVADPSLAPSVIIYDSKFMLETPPWLMMSTAMRSMDHAMELMCESLSSFPPSFQNMD